MGWRFFYIRRIHTAFIAEYLYFRYLIFFCEQAFQPSIVKCYASFRKGKDLILSPSKGTSRKRRTVHTAGAARRPRSVFFFGWSSTSRGPALYAIHDTKKSIYVYHIQTKHIHNKCISYVYIYMYIYCITCIY